MDAHAVLISQGWRGSGHSLHPTSDERGLTRPVLVARKQNKLGIGKKQHRTSDMWWMDAFDKSLKGLDTAEEGKVVQTVTNGGLDMIKKGGSRFVGSVGLYASFVKGESFSGTMTPEDAEEQPATKRQRKDKHGVETKEERSARKAAKRAARARGVLNAETLVPQSIGVSTLVNGEAKDVAVGEVESKEQRRKRREQRKSMRRAEENRIDDASKPTKRKRRRKG